jgi:hypothetical protein
VRESRGLAPRAPGDIDYRTRTGKQACADALAALLPLVRCASAARCWSGLLLAQSGRAGYSGAVTLGEVTQLLRTGDPSLVEADLVDLLVTERCRVPSFPGFAGQRG